MQIGQLLGDFFAQIVETVQVFPRVAHADFGLVAPLLVFGDAGGLLDEAAHFLRLGLDEAGNGALLDDGVAARAEAGAEEDVGDVLAAAAGVVEEIGRLASRVTWRLTEICA